MPHRESSCSGLGQLFFTCRAGIVPVIKQARNAPFPLLFRIRREGPWRAARSGRGSVSAQKMQRQKRSGSALFLHWSNSQSLRCRPPLGRYGTRFLPVFSTALEGGSPPLNAASCQSLCRIRRKGFYRGFFVSVHSSRSCRLRERSVPVFPHLCASLQVPFTHA